MNRTTPVALTALLALASGCAGDLEHPERFSDAPRCRASIDVPRLLAERCGSSICHNGAAGAPRAGLDFSVPDIEHQLVGVASTQCGQFLRVNPDDPDQSFLLAKLTDPPAGCGSRMPIVGILSQDELACVRAYVHEIAQTTVPLPSDGGVGTDASVEPDASIDGGI